jgi:hypothetical protein
MLSAYATPQDNATLNANTEKFSQAKMCPCNTCNDKVGVPSAKDESNDELSPSQKFYLQKVVKKWVRKVRKQGCD